MRNNHWKFRKNRAPRGLSFAILRSQKKRRISDRTAARTHHTPGFWYRGIATRVIPGSPAAYMGFRHWSGRFRFISTRTAIGRPRGYRLFAFCPRNDVLRVSAYMQPSDRAWQIGFAGVCMCIVEPQAHCYTRAATYTVAPTFVYVHTYRKRPTEAGRYLEGGVELPASQMGLRHAAQPRVSKRIHMYIYVLSPRTLDESSIVERGKPNHLIEIPRFREKIITRESVRDR